MKRELAVGEAVAAVVLRCQRVRSCESLGPLGARPPRSGRARTPGRGGLPGEGTQLSGETVIQRAAGAACLTLVESQCVGV